MLGENKNLKDPLKDSERKSLTSYGTGTFNGPTNSYYAKTNKLITALYMVTDTMEKEEPIRLKLRTLGIEILSDISISKLNSKRDISEKITAILSFLNIALDIGMISEMNCNILKKEFMELKQSIQESATQDHLWLEEFINRPSETELQNKERSIVNNLSFSKGQGTRIGVQKGSTLLKALKKVEGKSGSALYENGGFHSGFELLKNKRREEIVAIIKNNPSGMSIKDISLAVQSLGEAMGEKTLQRELISMLKDNVLKKTGEKRWSQYFLK